MSDEPRWPATGEFPAYQGAYLAHLPRGEPIVDLLERQIAETVALLDGLPEERARFRYAPGKWSVKDVLGHLADTERVFAYRALRFARGDATPLPGFEQDDYVPAAAADARPLARLLEELAAVRAASVALFRSFDEAAWQREGTASGTRLTVRAIPYVIGGHERHHVGVLQERYLSAS